MAALRPEKPKVALILRGGGVKGIAFVGALEVLEEHYEFEAFVGTSAGAITAILLGAGYSTSELGNELSKQDFRTFCDAGVFRAAWNLLARKGCFPGLTFRDWVRTLLAKKIESSPVRLHHLPKRVVVYASQSRAGTLRFDSDGENRDIDACFAARVSMSIPFLFIPQEHEGHRVYDGGLLNNFPVTDFLDRNRGANFIGLYLGERTQPPSQRRSILLDLIALLLDRNEPQVVDEHRSRIVVIEPAPIRTTDFSLADEEKSYLLMKGRLGALGYLEAQKMLSAEKSAELTKLRSEATALQAVITAARRRRRVRRRITAVAVLGLIAALVFGFSDLFPSRSYEQTTHEVKWLLTNEQPREIEEAIHAGRLTNIDTFGKPSRIPPGQARLELQVYFDTANFDLKRENRHLMLRVYLRETNSTGQVSVNWYFSQNLTRGTMPGHLWDRDELVVRRDDRTLAEMRTISQAVALLGAGFPREIDQKLGTIKVGPDQLQARVVIAVIRREWTYPDSSWFSRRKLALQLSHVVAYDADSILKASHLPILELFSNGHEEWDELEVEERFAKGSLTVAKPLWDRLKGLRLQFKLSEEPRGVMSKLERAFERLSLQQRSPARGN